MVQGVLLEPAAVYDDGALYCALGLTASTLAKARRRGRLRFTRQGRRVLYLGGWIHEWLQAEGVPTREVPADAR
jgi:hypothetical protein